MAAIVFPRVDQPESQIFYGNGATYIPRGLFHLIKPGTHIAYWSVNNQRARLGVVKPKLYNATSNRQAIWAEFRNPGEPLTQGRLGTFPGEKNALFRIDAAYFFYTPKQV